MGDSINSQVFLAVRFTWWCFLPKLLTGYTLAFLWCRGGWVWGVCHYSFAPYMDADLFNYIINCFYQNLPNATYTNWVQDYIKMGSVCFVHAQDEVDRSSKNVPRVYVLHWLHILCVFCSCQKAYLIKIFVKSIC